MNTALPLTDIQHLYSLAGDEKEHLKVRITRWNGLVRIFIHPLYEKWRGHEEKYRNDPTHTRLVEIEDTLSRLVSLPEENTPPIIIFEEKRYTERLKEWVLQQSSSLNCYIIETEPNDPTPTGYDWWEKDRAWKSLSTLFVELNITHILMGGIRLEVSSHLTDWTGKKPWVGRCVGIALSYLSKKKAGIFEVTISALTDPKGAREYLASLS